MRHLLVISLLLMVFACGDNHEGAPDAPRKPQCSDGIDNDGDGLRDYPKDPGCSNRDDESEDSLAAPACSDHRDNDGDGKVDYPEDPGCAIAQADSEDDDCPNGASCPQCSNDRDDDGNGTKDYPSVGCDSAADPIEFVENPTACGATLKIKHLPATGMDNGVLDATSTTSLVSPCGGTVGAPAIAYLMVLTSPTVVVISTVGSMVDTVVDLRSAMCLPDTAHIACNDNVGGTDKSSKVTRSLAAGAYYIIVKSKTAVGGTYNLQVEFFAGEGSTCTDTAQCGPGLVCRIPVNGTTKICTKPVCSDGLDDDADGKIDYPLDPGCTNPSDADEVDDCPNGPNCPDCADGVDNDSDSHIDYPLDTSCKAAGDASEACITSEPIETIVGPTTMGDTTGAFDDYDPTCNSTFTGLSPDLLYRLDIPALSSLTVNVNGFDTVHSLLDSTCGGLPIRCTDFNPMSVTNLAAGTYYLTVEGYFTTGVGPFTIDLSGIIAPGGACESPLVTAGALACGVGFLCDGPVGAKTCRTQCSDGIDNNSDGKTDFPNDPGCSSPADNTETTVCPGPMCPACSDGVDNDGDIMIDYPMDSSCQAAGGTSESCVTSEPIGLITAATTTGTTTGAVNDSTPVCGSTVHTAPDLIYQINLPAMSTLNLDLNGFDGAHYLRDSSCTGAPIACSDPSLMTVTNLAAGSYFVVVDGWDSDQGAFTLTTSGTIAPGGACEGQLATAGVITCGAGLMCDGPVGAKTCRNQCSDGIDNNGDGKIDYPNDPGCSAPNDTTENTVCPGATCPVCADGIDNDGDTFIDYPLDINCQAAGGTSESCSGEQDLIVNVVSGLTLSTLVGAHDDHTVIAGCSLTSPNGVDVMFSLTVPQMATLRLSTQTPSTPGLDTVMSLLPASCSEPSLACNEDFGPNFGDWWSLLALTNIAAGTYIVVVDAFSPFSTLTPFNFNVSGTIALNGSCEGPLVTSGAFTCAVGLTCSGTPGAKTCQ